MDPCNLVNKTVQPKKFIWMKTFSTFQTMEGKHPEISFLVSTQWLSITDCWKYKLALPWHYIYNSSHWNLQSSQAFRRKQDGTTKCELPSIERLCIHSMLAFKKYKNIINRYNYVLAPIYLFVRNFGWVTAPRSVESLQVTTALSCSKYPTLDQNKFKTSARKIFPWN